MPYLMYGAEQLWLNKSQILLGSSETCTFAIRGEGVSATHAIIEENNGAFWVSTISRLTEISVNGKKIKRQVLKDQDRVSIGSQTLVYHLYTLDNTHHSKAQIESLAAYQRLYEFSHRLAEHHHSTEFFEVILEELINLTNADQGLLMSTIGHQKKVRAVVDRFNSNELDDEVTHISESIVEQVCQSREPLLQNDLLDTELFKESESILELGLCGVMCAPLIFQGVLLGVIYVGNRRPSLSFQETDLKTLCVFSAQAATLLKYAITQEKLEDDNARLKGELEGFQYGAMIGSSKVMTQVYKRVDKLSQTDINLLIVGETGTGKELIAREVHRRSNRHEGPFIAINCGALPSNLIESELFGYRTGAFTGANTDRQGSFESAQGGTIFLDEIGEMPLDLQVKLLRVLEEYKVTPLGGSEAIKLDVRFICATNRHLQDEVNEGRFRLDLYYRINSFELELPPLRERGEDIILLAKYLLERLSKRYNMPIKQISLDAQRGIRRYTWPGNIRELENRIAQAVILSDHSEITLRDLNISPNLLSENILSLKEAQERFSQEYIAHVLALNGGNRTQAARDLAVDPRTIFRYLQKMHEA